MSESEKKEPLIQIDPKELAPAAVGVVIGIVILVGFFVLAVAMGLPTIVEQYDIPKQ